MNAPATVDLAERVRQAYGRVLEVVLRGGNRICVVKSPPGAGKTRLIESVAATAVQHAGLRVAVATPRAEQSFDLLRRLRANFPPMQIEVLQSESRPLPVDLANDPGIAAPTSDPSRLRRGAGVVVGVAAKFLVSVPRFELPEFDLLICDEAYQLAYKDLDPVLAIARQGLLVGDPGQLPPLIRADIARFETAPFKIHRPAPEELLRRYPEIPVVELPATWRLPQDSVDLVQPGFYADLPFESVVERALRRLRFIAAGMDSPVDRALDMVASGATIVGILAPERSLGRDEVDEEISLLMSAVCRRALERGAEWEGRGRLQAQDIGCADAHVASGAAVRNDLRRAAVPAGTMVDTPEIWQGLERPLMIIKNPLSGLARLDPFALEPGRMCVMLSRHQLGCIVVGRAGIGRALEGYQHDSGERPSGGVDGTWAGYRAHASLWNRLDSADRLVRSR